jgi:hypothetical protein
MSKNGKPNCFMKRCRWVAVPRPLKHELPFAGSLRIKGVSQPEEKCFCIYYLRWEHRLIANPFAYQIQPSRNCCFLALFPAASFQGGGTPVAYHEMKGPIIGALKVP